MIDQLGVHWLFLPVTIICAVYLLGIVIYGNKFGQNDKLANHGFVLPMAYTVFGCVMVLLSQNYWLAVALFTAFTIFIHILGFKAMSATISDKSGLGVTMFSGFVAMYGFSFVFISKGVIWLYHLWF